MNRRRFRERPPCLQKQRLRLIGIDRRRMRRGLTCSRRGSSGSFSLYRPFPIQSPSGSLPRGRRTWRLGALPDHQQTLWGSARSFPRFNRLYVRRIARCKFREAWKALHSARHAPDTDGRRTHTRRVQAHHNSGSGFISAAIGHIGGFVMSKPNRAAGPHLLTPFAFEDEFVPGNGKNRPWPSTLSVMTSLRRCPPL